MYLKEDYQANFTIPKPSLPEEEITDFLEIKYYVKKSQANIPVYAYSPDGRIVFYIGSVLEEYYLTSEYLIKLASNAGKLFESSKAHEKRLLLKMALQNLELKGKKARYNWINLFDKIAFYASRQAWLPIVDDVRTNLLI